MDSIQPQPVILHKMDTCETYEQELIGEEPLLIRIEDRPYSVVMRTPGEEIPHVAGFCLGEGLVDEFDDFSTIGYCEQMDPNVVNVKLQPARQTKIGDLLKRQGFISQTSCGICGKEMIEDICQDLTPVTDKTAMNIQKVIACVDEIIHFQDFYRRTGGSHAAMLFDAELNVLSMAEDVGRHNALDKTIGKIFLNRHLAKARLAVLSSRISYELVQKAARAHLPILFSISRPTALAVELGQELNMTLACMGKESEMLIFCGEERLIRE